MPKFEKVCLITKDTPLRSLEERYGSRDQARFVMRSRNQSTQAFEHYDRAYKEAIEKITKGLPSGTRISVVDLKYLPTYQFDPAAAVVTVGPDGLVANTAKYLSTQPLIAVNPDPTTIDGVLARNTIVQALLLLNDNVQPAEHALSMAEARLQDGQSLLAVNDLFIGRRTHVSARYQIQFQHMAEEQSSSGVIVSTGAGSTGWRRSVLTGAAGIVEHEGSSNRFELAYGFPPDARQLVFAVREPFISRASAASLIAGTIMDGEKLRIVSQMPQEGIIFSDGVEADFLEFNSGSSAEIQLSERVIRLWSATNVRSTNHSAQQSPQVRPTRQARRSFKLDR